MAEAQKKQKHTLSDEARKRKREIYRVRDRTRVTIREAFTRWRELKETRAYKSDTELADF